MRAILILCAVVLAAACGDGPQPMPSGDGDAGVDFGAAFCRGRTVSTTGMVTSVKLCQPDARGVTCTECATCSSPSGGGYVFCRGDCYVPPGEVSAVCH